MKLNIDAQKPKKAVLTEEILKKYKRQSPEKYAVKYGLLTPAEVLKALRSGKKLHQLKNVNEEGDYIVPIMFNEDGVAVLDEEEVARRKGEDFESTETSDADEEEKDEDGE